MSICPIWNFTLYVFIFLKITNFSHTWQMVILYIIQYSQRNTMINHCDIIGVSLILVKWIYLLNCSIYGIFKISFVFRVLHIITQNAQESSVNRLNRAKNISSVPLRREIHLSQWFITLCLWLYCTYAISAYYH